MKPILLIALLFVGCASNEHQIKPLFSECPGLMPTPSPLGKNETIAAFEVRIELAREEVVKRHAACLKTVAQMGEWIAHH